MAGDESVLNRIHDEFRLFMRALGDGESAAWLAIDLTMPQLKSLFVVWRKGRVSSRGLAQVLGVGPSAVTPLVDRLVGHGYARREEDADDRRITWICPTERGLSLIDRLQTLRREQIGKVIAGLTQDERESVLRGLELLRRASEQYYGISRQEDTAEQRNTIKGDL